MISSSEVKKKAEQLKIGDALSTKKRGRFLGLTLDEYIKYFFSGNAGIAILVLVLIMVFLFKEGAGFVPMYKNSLELYRSAGLEYADIIRGQIEEHRFFSQKFNLVQNTVSAHYESQGMSREAARARTANIQSRKDEFGALIANHQALAEELEQVVIEVRNQKVNNDNLRQAVLLFRSQGDEETARMSEEAIQPVDFQRAHDLCAVMTTRYLEENEILHTRISGFMELPIQLPTPEAEAQYAELKEDIATYQAKFDAYSKRAFEWDPDKQVPLYRGFSAFILGKEWLTNSFWQDFYGIIPLFVGSLMISSLALAIAVPLSVSAAIYVNQIATSTELKLIKPYIEFIEALPSIVLGFFGIVVFGSFLREVSQVEWLAWFPGFPMSERLTIATAGVLLALMAVPTIFTLVEDSLNNVPRHYVEASYALGANKMQTIFKIMVPAALSGIVAAVLLGLGRVIGETMVVLLCAGGMIAIPDFTQGIGAWFQPAHTMTGIIAQELGEVASGTLHYRALFMVGLVLFFISLLLNFCSQFIIKRFRISE
ncbi:MAG: phosphate ABC transporter permease subunit PstC [Verrucomicrobiota bacterium]